MLQKLSATPTAVWPTDGEASKLQTIVWDQAATMAAQESLIDDYQEVLSNAQAVPNATGTGNSTGTTALAVTAVTNVIKIGATVSGTGVPTGMKVIAQASGTAGGAGTYTTDVVSTLGNIALTFSPGGGNSPWPPFTDAPDLMTIAQLQTSILRTQNALLTQYQDLLNASSTAPPPP